MVVGSAPPGLVVLVSSRGRSSWLLILFFAMNSDVLFGIFITHYISEPLDTLGSATVSRSGPGRCRTAGSGEDGVQSN